MFKVNNKNTRTSSDVVLVFFIVNFEHISHLVCSVSTVDVEQIIVSWVTSTLEVASVSLFKQSTSNQIKANPDKYYSPINKNYKIRSALEEI